VTLRIRGLAGAVVSTGTSAGTGTSTSNNTWGTIDLGGASLQIAFYVPRIQREVDECIKDILTWTITK
jgi:hypothetical protein